MSDSDLKVGDKIIIRNNTSEPLLIRGFDKEVINGRGDDLFIAETETNNLGYETNLIKCFCEIQKDELQRLKEQLRDDKVTYKLNLSRNIEEHRKQLRSKYLGEIEWLRDALRREAAKKKVDIFFAGVITSLFWAAVVFCVLAHNPIVR